MAALGQSLLSASRGWSCAAPLVLAACCTPARVCTRLSCVLAARCPIVGTRLSRRPLRSAYSSTSAFVSVSSRFRRVWISPPEAPALPAARPQPPVLSVPCGADRRPPGRAARGVQPLPARGGRGGRWKRPF